MVISNKIVSLSLVLVSVFGCASYYPISTQYRQEAQGGPTYSMVKDNPDSFIGKMVIWGGKILKTSNDSTGSEIMVLQSPVDENGRPGSGMQSEGRFLAVSPTFLDPEIYKTSRMITVAGTVVGSKTMLVDKLNYTYPVIRLKQIHIWKRTQTYYYYPYPGYGWGWGFDDGYDGSFGDGYYDGIYDGFDDEGG
ncbi:MAG: hypothetical protein GX640_12220 [Fibrobacter sp.]|nr:hypothetical protein [Fibrobacter sp.]